MSDTLLPCPFCGTEDPMEIARYKISLAERALFIAAVAHMRDRQREYFRTRDTDALKRSKEAERRVDQMLLPAMPSAGRIM